MAFENKTDRETLTRWLSPDRFLHILEDPWFQLVIELQDQISVLTYDFWRQKGLRTLHLPITTHSISSPMGLGSDSLPVHVDLFGIKTYLADSMQFMLEYGCRFCRAGSYYVMPSFRGESADESHLCQFYHSEVEIPCDLSTLMDTAEEYLRFLSNGILSSSGDRIQTLTGKKHHLEQLAERDVPFQRLSFQQAAELLDHDPRFVYQDPGGWRTLTRAGEQKLLDENGAFLWVTHWDHLAVPFYQAFADEDPGLAKNADLLFGIGEVIGLGERHLDGEQVARALSIHQVPDAPYRWYMDLKTKHPMQTSGFGMGIERFLMWVLDHRDIRDFQVLPRFNGITSIP
jgi:asparaginyl-tRNA synthetase